MDNIGGNKSIHLDIRIIAATKRNLEDMIKAKQFREDVWFRLNVFPIWLPPLRQRQSDIPALVQHFIEKKSKEMKIPAIPPLAADAIAPLMSYHWPGNVRELENIVERALILHPESPLTFDNSVLPWEKTVTEPSQQETEVEKLDDIIARHIHLAVALPMGKFTAKAEPLNC